MWVTCEISTDFFKIFSQMAVSVEHLELLINDQLFEINVHMVCCRII